MIDHRHAVCGRAATQDPSNRADCPLVASLSVLFLTAFPSQMRPRVFLFWLTTRAQSVWSRRGQGLTDSFTIRRAPQMLVTEQMRFSVRSWRHREARVWLLCVEASGKMSANFTSGKFWSVHFISFLKNFTGEEMYLPKVWLNEAQSLGPGMETPLNVAGGEASQASNHSREGDSPQ